MAKTDFQSIDEYINTFSGPIKDRLEQIRQIIHQAVPQAEEGISYQIPVFKYQGPILYFSAFTNHISIAAPPPTMADFKEDIKGYKSSVSVVQLPHDQPLPEDLIRRMAEYRLANNTKQAK